MTQDEAVIELNALDTFDSERSHMTADDIVLDVLKANGLEVVAAAFEAASERIGFWYA